MIHEKQNHPPLFALPRWKRRLRLRRIISVRRKGKTPIGLFLTGWRVGKPQHPERFHKQVLISTYYSVRGDRLSIHICRVTDAAMADMIR